MARSSDPASRDGSFIGRGGRRWLSASTALTFLFLYFPILVLVVYSFTEARVFAFPPSGFSLRWYDALLHDQDMHKSVVNSLIVASCAVPLSLVMGIAAAFSLDRFRFPGRRVFERLLMLPLMIPGLITGLAILLVMKQLDFGLSLATVVVGHSIAWMPVVVTQVYARLRRFDRRLEEASMDLGANRSQTFFRITLPNIRTAIIGSGLLVFTLSFDEIAITFFLTGADNTLPMHIWSMMREGITPQIAAIATITVTLSVVLILIGTRLSANTKDG